MVDAVATRVGAFFVGPGKCGTSWIFDACRAHPDLDTGRIKEPGEFLEPQPDIAVYERLWEGTGLRCDFSNTYFFSDTAAAGVHRYNPEARICITIRDPVERLVSHYMFMRRNDRVEGPIDRAILARPDLVDRCRYAAHAARWLERFPPDQVLVLRLETLRADPVRYRQALFDFLEVADDAAYAPARASQAAAAPRSRLLARGAKNLAELARRARLFGLIDRAKRSPLVRLMYRRLPDSYQAAHVEAIPPDVRAELREDYERFKGMISRLPQGQFV